MHIENGIHDFFGVVLLIIVFVIVPFALWNINNDGGSQTPPIIELKSYGEGLDDGVTIGIDCTLSGMEAMTEDISSVSAIQVKMSTCLEQSMALLKSEK